MGKTKQSEAKRQRTQAASPAVPVFSLDIVEDAGTWSDIPHLESTIRNAVTALAKHPRIVPAMPASACLALADDAAVQKLNGTYRAKDRPTNVLSFPAQSPPLQQGGKAPFIGDIVLAEGTVRREAIDLNIPVPHHIQHLVVHGLLHLLGFDHEADDDAAIMEAIETETLASLGIPDPYSLTGTSEPTS